MTTVKRKRIDDGSAMPVVPKERDSVYYAMRDTGSNINWIGASVNNLYSVIVSEPGTYLLTAGTNFVPPDLLSTTTHYFGVRTSNTASSSGAVPGAINAMMRVFNTTVARNWYSASAVVVVTEETTFHLYAHTDGLAATGIVIDVGFTSRYSGAEMMPVITATRVGEI